MPPRWQPSLDDYIDLPPTARRRPRRHRGLPRIALAESALHAPFASFGGIEEYPTLVEQAAVLLQHLAKNHQLPDANKRAAFLLTARFFDANGLLWGPPAARPTPAWTNASLPAKRATTRSSRGSANVRAKKGMSRALSPDTRSSAVARCTAVSIASGSDLPMAASPGHRQLRARLCPRS